MSPLSYAGHYWVTGEALHGCPARQVVVFCFSEQPQDGETFQSEIYSLFLWLTWNNSDYIPWYISPQNKILVLISEEDLCITSYIFGIDFQSGQGFTITIKQFFPFFWWIGLNSNLCLYFHPLSSLLNNIPTPEYYALTVVQCMQVQCMSPNSLRWTDLCLAYHG